MAEVKVTLRDSASTPFNVSNWQTSDGNGDTVLMQRVVDGLAVGTWGYVAGASGSETLTGGKRVREITCYATNTGSFTIDGGDSITVPAGVGLSLSINGLLEDPALVFTDTSTYFVQYVS